MFPSAELVVDCGRDSFILQGALILNVLWKARNYIVHEEGIVEVGKLMQDLGRSWKEHSAISIGSSHSRTASIGSTMWVRLDSGVTKLNCDATVGSRFSSIAVVVPAFTLFRKVNTIIPLQAEANAILWASKLAISHGLTIVIIESDCNECVQAVKRGSCIPWRIQVAIGEFQRVMDELEWWNLQWIRRTFC